MSQNTYKWRNNPAVIAKYVHDREVPKGAEVTLKPNEACVVVEDGRISGIATQKHMEVNPEAGLLSKMFGRGNPKRTFLFVFLGPHELILRLEGMTSDGRSASGFMVMRVGFSREGTSRLLQLPAKGNMEITSATLVSILESEVNARLKPIIHQLTEDQLRNVDATSDLMMEVRTGLRSTFESLGLQLQTSFVNWNTTEAEKVLKMRADLSALEARNAIMEEQEIMEMENILAANLRAAELEARSRMSSLAAEERAKSEVELAALRAEGDLDLERWNQAAKLHSEREDLRRDQEMADADHQVGLAEREAERQRILQETQLETEERRQKSAMDMFDQVQARKKDRMAMQADREQNRIDAASQGSEAIIATLTEIAQSSKDPEVAMEALRQLSEIRKADVDAAKDAYIDD
ncbi:MAG TPA: hypothetical protein QF555_02870 [Candidatus Thalassarchaeaceae archaeon]|nr:hypothetical protein [Candidatus Thalassarchaeaceae archaeon]